MITKTVWDTGETLVTDADDSRVKALALRMGWIERITAEIMNNCGQRFAAGFGTDGDELVAVFRWNGFPNEIDNGWLSYQITPKTEKGVHFIYSMIKKNCIDEPPPFEFFSQNNSNN